MDRRAAISRCNLLHAYLIGPLQRSYQELNNRQVEGIVSNINQQFSQLEVTLSVWGNRFKGATKKIYWKRRIIRR